MIRVAERVLAKGFVFLSRAFGLIQVHLSSDSELHSVVFINKVATFSIIDFPFLLFRKWIHSLWILLAFTGSYRVLLGFTGFY